MHNLILNTKALDKIDIKALQSALKNNDADAMFNVGMMYYQGIQTQKNITKALQWLNKAVALNHRDAAYNLGLIYLCGLDVPCNIKKGRDYMEAAAKNGAAVLDLLRRIDSRYRNEQYRSATFDLDLLDEQYTKRALTQIAPKGIDLPLIIALLVMAFGLYLFIFNFLNVYGILIFGVALIYLGFRPFKDRMPAKKTNPKQGQDKACASLDERLSCLNPNEIERKATDNHSESLYMLGYMYYRGIHKPLDYEQAAQWFKKASMKRNQEAAYLLGIMYIKGEGVKANTRRGFELLETAADHYHKDAQTAVKRIKSKYSVNELNHVNFDLSLLEPVEEKTITPLLKHPILIYLVALFIALSVISIAPTNWGYISTIIVLFLVVAMIYITKKILFKK